MSVNQFSHLLEFEQDSLLVKQALHPPSSASVENQTIINEILNESLAIDANFDAIDLDLLVDEIKYVPDVIPPQTSMNNPPIMNGPVHFTDCKSFVEEGLAVPSNGQWSSFALQLRKVTNQFLRKHIRSVRPKTTPAKEYFSPTLKEEDMDLFGYSPMTDQLILVRCNHCTKTVKASRFNTHLAHCLKAAETVENKVAIEEKVNGKRKTAPVPDTKLKKVKDEPLESTETTAKVKTTIIIPTSSTTSSSTGESPTKKKKTSKSSKKDKEEKKKHKSEKKAKKDKKSKKSKTSTTTVAPPASSSSLLTAPVQVELAKDIPVAITVPETLPSAIDPHPKQTKQAKKTKTEPSHNVPSTGFIPLAGGNIIFHNNVFMNNVQLNQALSHNILQADSQTRSSSPSTTMNTTTNTPTTTSNSDGKMNSPYTVTVPIQILPQQPPFTATQTTTNPPSPNPATSTVPQSPKLKKKVKKIKKDLPGTPQFTQPHLQIQFQQYQQSLQRQFVNQPFTIQQLPNGVQQIYIHGLPQQILPGQPIQLAQQPITIQYQPLSQEQLQQIQQMSHGQVPVATTSPTTQGQSVPTTPQLVSVPAPDAKTFASYSPVATAMPRQAFAAIPVPTTQQRRPIEIHSFPNGPTAQVYHITANGLVPQTGNKHYFPANVNVAVQPTNIVDTAKELIKTKSPVASPKTIVASPVQQGMPGSKQEWFRISKTASIIQAAQSQPPSPTTPRAPQASPPNNVNTPSS